MRLFSRSSGAIVLQLLVLAGVAGIGLLTPMKAMDIRGLDLFWTWHPPHPDIAIIAIDEKSIQEIGRWPWKRSVHARLLEALKPLSPHIIAFDISFLEPSTPAEDAALAEALKTSPSPIFLATETVTYASGEEKILPPIPLFSNHPNIFLGHAVVQELLDGKARTFPEPITLEGKALDPFGIAIAQKLGVKDIPQSAIIHFAGPAGTFPTYSYADVLAGKVPAEQLREKILLIGATASNLHDIVLVPFANNAMAGIEWQANVLDNALLGRAKTLPPRGILLLAGFLVAAGLLLLGKRLNAQRSIGFTISIPLLVVLGSYLAFRAGFALPYLWVVLLIALSFILSSLERWYHAEREKKILKRSLEGYLSPAVLHEILRDSSKLGLGGERREISAFFSDIRSFTTMTESTDPAVLSHLLSEYFTAMTEEIFKTDGVISSFMGDGIYAFWGAPLEQKDHAERAVRTGIAMMKKLVELRPHWERHGLPFVDIGIGVNTGMATVGNLGSEKRFDYTAIGDTVNAGARLESLNKEHKTHMLVSQAVVDRLPPDIKVRFVSDIVVKGKTVPLKVYEVTEENWKTGVSE